LQTNASLQSAPFGREDVEMTGAERHEESFGL